MNFVVNLAKFLFSEEFFFFFLSVLAQMPERGQHVNINSEIVCKIIIKLII